MFTNEKVLNIRDIPLNIEKLEYKCKNDSTFIKRCRECITRAHVSKNGIPENMMEFIKTVTINNPSLAFALCPTTLHDQSRTNHESYFVCDPFNSREYTYPTSYTPCVEDASMAKMIDTDSIRSNYKIARYRFFEFISSLGHFPWKHPSLKGTGCVIAGGLVSGCLLSEDKWSEIEEKTDIDFFVYGPTLACRSAMAMILATTLSKVNGFRHFKLFKCVIQVSIKNSPDIQIISPFAESPLGVLMNFDSTFIQIGYDGEKFYCTPGYCFFTPRNESLICRYNFRWHRFYKMMKRGFVPVTDNRGHIMYPKKLLFSNRWKLNIGDEKRKIWKVWVVDENNIQIKASFDLDKPDIYEGRLSLIKLKENYKPDAQTLSNGFDIYTRGVNNTLPLPEDGDTSDLYKYNVLLRNIRMLPVQEEYNLASSNENPLMVDHVDFVDPEEVYPRRKYTSFKADNEPVRIIEGIFMFNDMGPTVPVIVNEPDKKERQILKNQKIIDRIEFEDLHTSIQENEKLLTLPVQELGCLIEAFAKNGFYESSVGRISRKDGMVKIRTVVAFNPCMVFGVDDLFLPHSSLDQNHNRLYNGVVHLSNLRRWIIKAHKHMDEVCFSDERDMIVAMLREEAKKELGENDGEPELGVKVSEFFRALKHVLNNKNFIEIANKESCMRPHATEGLAGEMPVLFCTRLYVTKEDINE